MEMMIWTQKRFNLLATVPPILSDLFAEFDVGSATVSTAATSTDSSDGFDG